MMRRLEPAKESARKPAPRRAGRMSRRSVLKLGTLLAATLPLVITLSPTEARAQDSS